MANPLSALGWDRYAYVEGNPLRFVDPSGFAPRDRDFPVDGGIQPVRILSSGPSGPQKDPRGEAGHNDAMEAAAKAQGNATNGVGPQNQAPGGGGGAMGQPSVSDPSGRPVQERPPGTSLFNPALGALAQVVPVPMPMPVSPAPVPLNVQQRDALGEFLYDFVFGVPIRLLVAAVDVVLQAQPEIYGAEGAAGATILNADQLKVPKPGVGGKEGAKDVPSWAKGNRPRVGESGKDFAKRLLDAKYGPGNYDTGPGSEFNKVRQWGDRAFVDP